jgi:hypothetical protein
VGWHDHKDLRELKEYMVNVIVNEPSSVRIKNEKRCPSRVDRCDSPSSARCVECFVNSGIVFSASIYRFYKELVSGSEFELQQEFPEGTEMS